MALISSPLLTEKTEILHHWLQIGVNRLAIVIQDWFAIAAHDRERKHSRRARVSTLLYFYYDWFAGVLLHQLLFFI
ncbi:hypothetical protein ES703_111629 [subsurface metagenome]